MLKQMALFKLKLCTIACVTIKLIKGYIHKFCTLSIKDDVSKTTKQSSVLKMIMALLLTTIFIPSSYAVLDPSIIRALMTKEQVRLTQLPLPAVWGPPVVKEEATKVLISIGGSSIEAEELAIIAGSLGENTNLISFSIGHLELDDAGVELLIKALQRNISLSTLALTVSKIGPAGARALAALLKTHRLEVLNLRYNQLGDAGILALAGALEKNRYLRTLNLDHTQIGNVGAQALADALGPNTTLVELNLANNGFGDVAAEEIARLLKINRSITTLNLAFNRIGDAGVEAIANAMITNTVIRTVTLNNNPIGETRIDALIRLFNILDRNNLIARVIAKIKMRMRVHALLLGYHPRTGTDSPLAFLDRLLLPDIIRMLPAPDAGNRDDTDILLTDMLLNMPIGELRNLLHIDIDDKETIGDIIRIQAVQDRIIPGPRTETIGSAAGVVATAGTLALPHLFSGMSP